MQRKYRQHIEHSKSKGSFYIADNPIPPMNSLGQEYRHQWISSFLVWLIDYVPGTEYVTPNLDVAEMQVSLPDYSIFALSLCKSRCVTRRWNPIDMWYGTLKKCTALPQYADANELSRLQACEQPFAPRIAAATCAPTNLSYTPVRHGGGKGGISTFHH